MIFRLSHIGGICYPRLPNHLHPWKLTCPLKSDHFSREYIFQPSIFRGHVSFQGSKVQYDWTPTKPYQSDTKLTFVTLYSPKGCLGSVCLKGTLPETKILAKMDGWKISRLGPVGAVSRPIFRVQTCWESFSEGKSIGVSEIQTFSYISVAVVLGWGWHPSTSRKLNSLINSLVFSH